MAGTRKATSKSTSTAKGIDWAKLKDKRGSAKAIPELVATMAQGRLAGAEAHSAVKIALLVPGKAFSASAATLGLLVDVATTKGPARAAALGLALEILLLSEVERYLPTGLDLRDTATKRRFASTEAQAVVATARDAAPRLWPLLAADDPRVRAGAATLLGFLATGGEAAATLLDVKGETNPDLRARRIFAATHVALASGVSLADSLAPLLEAAEPLVASSARVARRLFVDAGDPRADATAVLRATLETPREPLGLDDLAFALLAEGPRAGHQHSVALATVDVLTAAPLTAHARNVWPDRVLGWHFPLRKGARRAYVDDPLDLRSLTDVQREVLLGLSGVMHHAGSYDQRGLPPDLRSRRRLLGLDPRGVLEDVLRSPRTGKEALPRWRILRLGLEKYGTTSKSVDAQTYLAKDWFDLPPARWLELWTEVQARAYGTYGRHPTPADAMKGVSAEEVKEWADRYLRECATSIDADLESMIGWYVALPAARSESTLPEAYDRILTLHGNLTVMREVLAKIPPARRANLMARRFAELDGEGAHLAERVAEELLDAVPEALEPLLQWLERRDDRWTPRADGSIAWALKRARKSVKAIDDGLRRYAKTEPLSPTRGG